MGDGNIAVTAATLFRPVNPFLQYLIPTPTILALDVTEQFDGVIRNLAIIPTNVYFRIGGQNDSPTGTAT